MELEGDANDSFINITKNNAPRTMPPSPPPPRTFSKVACKWKVSDCLLVGELVVLGELDNFVGGKNIAGLGLEDKCISRATSRCESFAYLRSHSLIGPPPISQNKPG